METFFTGCSWSVAVFDHRAIGGKRHSGRVSYLVETAAGWVLYQFQPHLADWLHGHDLSPATCLPSWHVLYQQWQSHGGLIDRRCCTKHHHGCTTVYGVVGMLLPYTLPVMAALTAGLVRAA